MHYLRLLLIDRKNMSGIKLLDIDLSHNQHLVLGSNGSGKSNYLRELSGLPPDVSLFGPNGQKSIWYKLDNGDIVEFTSYPNQRKHHQVFLNDNRDNNLNVSGTQTEQRELVKRFTGVTQIYFDLFVLGKVSFCDTKPTLRRTLFDDMSNASYDYAMGVYTRVKDGHREQQAIVKHLTKRLSELNNQKLSDEDIYHLEHELERIDKELAEWYELRKKDRRKVNTIRQEMSEIASNNRSRVSNLLKWFEKIEDDLDTPAKVKEKIAGINGEIKNIREQISILDIELSKLKRGLQYDSKSKQSLITEISQVESELIQATVDSYSEYLDSTDNLPSLEDTASSVKQLQNALVMLSDDAEDQYDKNTITELETKRKEIQAQLNTLDRQLSEYRLAIEHYETHAKTDGHTCPNCNTYFYPFADAVDITKMKEDISAANTEYSRLEAEYAALEPTLLAATSYLDSKRYCATLIKAVPFIAKWWLHFNISLSQPSKASLELNALLQSLISKTHQLDLTRQLHALQKQLALYADMDTVRENELRIRVAETDTLLTEQHSRLADLLNRVQLYTRYNQTLTKRLADSDAIEESHIRLTALHTELVESVVAEFIDQHLADLNTKRSGVFSAVSAARNNTANILTVTKELRMTEQSVLEHSTLMKALSPTDGIIAEGMMGFIQHFVHEMNRTIGKLWTDPLTISPCLVGDNGVELDYLFPVRTLHETPEDVSVCSSGQKEIIDLAFREAGMRCLGLSTHPILFDEWGVRMDETHKQKTAVLLSELTEQTDHDQIIMVSHQNVVHDSFTDIRRLVLCDKNIVIDGEYNDHVLIEK